MFGNEAGGLVDPEEWEPVPVEVWDELGPLDWDELAAVDETVRSDGWVHTVVSEVVSPHTLAVLADADPRVLSEQARSLALRELEKVSRYVESLKAELVAVIAGPRPVIRPDGRVDDVASHEVAVATWTSVYAADREVWLARDLVTRLPATAQALRQGRVSLPQALALSQAISGLDDGVVAEVEDKVLTFAHRQDTGTFKASLRRWLSKLDPDFTTKARDARKDCEVTHTPHDDGTGSLYLRGPLEATTAIAQALDAYAAGTKAKLGGTAAQRKLAGLRDWAETYLASPGCPTRHGRPPTVLVTIDLPTLLGMRDSPAYIPGVGPVPADAARWAIADGAPMRRLVTDPLTGHLLDLSPNTYTASPGLAEYLITRNVTSAGPHSHVPAAGCDIEHNTPHGHHGQTTRINCTPVDRRWHRAKTHGGWTYTKNEDTGVVTWTSPTGLTCDIEPYDYV